MIRWIVDGNNVFGSRPDGWWNDRPRAQRRLAQRVAEWCRTHEDSVVLVFDRPLAAAAAELAGGNLRIVEAPRRGRDAADDHIVDLVDDLLDAPDVPALTDDAPTDAVVVVTSDHGLRDRLPAAVDVRGVGQFRDLIEY